MTTRVPGWIPTLFLSGLVAAAIVACSGGTVTPSTTGETGGKKKDGGTSTGGSSGGSWVPPSIDGSIPQGGGSGSGSGTCGNGVVEEGESCDDGNTEPNDGCTPICQRQADYKCETPGKKCVYDVRCGDGVLATVEACDDGNSEDGDGCSADCKTVEKGWQCRVPGHRCVPLCGDGIKTAGEGCDDGDTKNDDGCSSTCQVEPGWDCKGEPSKCTKSVCGNGKVETGEACDNGDKNGLMFGDGSGCSKSCTKEPVCRDKDGHNTVCTPRCGDGNLDTGEDCDDGNQNDGDGCTSKCKVEQGFTCSPQTVTDTQDCKGTTGKCLVMPIIYRDFKSEMEKGGHPDFFNMGNRDSSGNATTWCVPNSGGPAKKGDSTARCWDIADPVLVNGKPVYNKKRADNLCDCQFTDWSYQGNDGHVPDYAEKDSPLRDSGGWHTGLTSPWPSGKPQWIGRVRIVKDAESFGQWFADNTFNKKVERTIELAPVKNGFQFSSPPHSVSGGFFPIDDVTTDEAPLCNLWPYWYWNGYGKSTKPTCTDSHPQYLFPPSVTSEGWVNLPGKLHNSWFSSEVHYLFAYNEKGMSLQFYGDDDLFIYINGQLVLDLGGVHQRLPGKVTVAGPSGKATIVEGGSIDETTGDIVACTDTTAGNPNCRNRELDLKLVPGSIYEIAIFHADRHPTESNYQLTLSGFTTTRSVCQPRCGDGIVAAGEECDDGDKNNDTLYGGCTTKCKFGPFCGDGNKDEGETCDLGRDNGVQADGSMKCTEGCKLPQRCGDGVVDKGEECDLGEKNGQPGQLCTDKCTLIVL